MIRKKDFYKLQDRIYNIERELFHTKNPHRYELFEKISFHVREEKDPTDRRGKSYRPCDKTLTGIIIARDIGDIFDPRVNKFFFNNRYIVCISEAEYEYVNENSILSQGKSWGKN